MIVVGDDKARGAKPVAVQGGADLAPIRESDRGGAVPRLHQRGVIFVESLAPGIHQLVAGPGFRDQHHHRVRQGIAARHQKLERVVETGGVGLAVRNKRPHLVQIWSEQFGFHGAAARIDPVDVAPHRIDLAIMGDEAERMRQLPAGECVGGEALMYQRDRRLGEWVGEIAIEAAHIMGQEQALIDHRAGGKAGHIKLGYGGLLVFLGQLDQRILGLLADGEQLALERVLVLDAEPTATMAWRMSGI